MSTTKDKTLKKMDFSVRQPPIELPSVDNDIVEKLKEINQHSSPDKANIENTFPILRPGKTQLDRQDIETLADGKVSNVFGPDYQPIDSFDNIIKTAKPPVLFIDKVIDISGQQGVFDQGSIETVTEIRSDTWFLHNKRVPASIVGEAGIGGIILLSWLGFDFILQGKYKLRAIGCKVKLFKALPTVGDNLYYQIKITKYLQANGNHLFFFDVYSEINHEPFFTLENHQIGFFDQQALHNKKNTQGRVKPVLAQNPSLQDFISKNPWIPQQTCFDTNAVNCFANGDLAGCFGEKFVPNKKHINTPRIQNDNMKFLDKITHFEPNGGPKQLGYIRGEYRINPDMWFFKAHFPGDPCMPATFIVEGGFQTLCFYATALGMTLEKDDYYFSIQPTLACNYDCRAEVIPTDQIVVYELFIQNIVDQPQPTITAQLFISVDGTLAVKAQPFSVTLLPNHSLQGDTTMNDVTTQTNSNDATSQASHTPKKNKPMFSREDLVTHASGNISEIFGPAFKQQDQYARQVRMPEPPLLLTDRVMKIEGEAGSMAKGASKGAIWTETDVKSDSWFLHENHIPAGIMIEAGQADLMLISWLGIDNFNKGERIYRLLGCDLTYYGSLAKVGDTLCYEIHLDGLANHGDIRLMFFHYECRVNGELRMRVRNGQAGFFSDQELADSAGVIWDAKTAEYKPDAQLDPPKIPCQHSSFSHEQISAFCNGDAYACFGEGFEYAQTHNKPPRIQTGKMRFIDHITDFNPKGGPAGRGYLRAVQKVSPDDWFFKGHFKNDPCMPGTLMGEAGIQVLSFYLAACGFSVDKDGWRFEPTSDAESLLRCRGQCTLTSKEIVYELFIDEIIAKPYPTVRAHLMATIDGLKAFHAANFGACLVPDWPLQTDPALLGEYDQQVEVAQIGDLRLDYKALLSTAWGKPSHMLGKMYQRFDNGDPVPRSPGPPYHFLTRVTKVTDDAEKMQANITAVIEYDIPEDAWYYNENSDATMPYCVFLETALQPCGWLSSYVGSVSSHPTRLLYRNLDGTGTMLKEIKPGAKCMRTETTMTKIFKLGDMIIQSFDLKMYCDNELVYTLVSDFGFFPENAFENQAGLPVSDEQRQLFEKPCDFNVDLTTSPAEFFTGTCRLANPMLLMIDRVTGFWPDAGQNGLGVLRAEKDVDPSEWFFKAHFFQDPVQPGSLGIEAMIQLLQFYMLQQGMHNDIPQARFQPVALDNALTWKYRGQVVPNNKVISTTMEIQSVTREDNSILVTATASLWVDGKRIYEASNLGMRIVSGKKA